LEFKINPVVEVAGKMKSMPSGQIIEHPPDPNKALEVFTGFVPGLEPSKLSWLRTVILSNEVTCKVPFLAEIKEMARTLPQFTRLCQDNPQLKIR
jgi:hypothetical protein